MAAPAAPVMAVNGIMVRTASAAYPESTAAKETRVLISGFSRHVYNLGWVLGASRSSRYHYIRKPPQLMVMSTPGGLSATSSKLYVTKTSNSYGCGSLFSKLGLDFSSPSDGPIQRVRSGLGTSKKRNVSTKAQESEREIDPFPHCIVLDIEGTTTPISFVTEVLFPYARANVGRHLSATYDNPETKDDIELLRSQVHDDLKQGIAGAVPIPPEDAGKEKVIASLVANVEAMIKADRKITALKELQEIEAVVFDDVPKALEKWHALGKKVYIYSSGSRLAQRLIFGNTNYGDLRKYLCGFFDTKVGNKRERSSYIEIFETLGVDKPSNILFLTDVSQEAEAAKAAGLEVMISIRPGNGPLPENHKFRTINSFFEI